MQSVEIGRTFHYDTWDWLINFPYPLPSHNCKGWTKNLRIYAAEKSSVELIRVRHFLLVVQSYLDFLLPCRPSQQHPSFFASAVFQRTAPLTLRNCVPQTCFAMCIFGQSFRLSGPCYETVIFSSVYGLLENICVLFTKGYSFDICASAPGV